MATRHAGAFVAGLFLLAAHARAQSAGQPDAQAPAGRIPPPAAGRVVIADAETLVFRAEQRTIRLADLDAEAAEVVRRINEAPGTWQSYLLCIQEDLPERLFHPGFTFVLDKPGAKAPAPGPEASRTTEAPVPAPADPSIRPES